MSPQPHPQLSHEGSSVFNKLKSARRLNRILSTVAPGLASSWALRLFSTPRRHKTPARERAWIASVRPLELRVGGRKLNAWEIGSGPTVYLSHGWEGRASQLGAFIQPLVDAGFHVVGVDAYAHGGSDGRTANLLDFADVAAEIAWRFKPLHGVIAHSFSTAAMTFAISQGSAIGRAVYLGAPAQLTPYTTLFAYVLGFPDSVRQEMIRKLERRFQIAWDDVQPAKLAAEIQGPPLLAVWDKDDTDVVESMAREFYDAWNGSKEWFETSGLGHQRMLRSEQIVERAVGFMREEFPEAGRPASVSAALSS